MSILIKNTYKYFIQNGVGVALGDAGGRLGNQYWHNSRAKQYATRIDLIPLCIPEI